MANRQRGKRTVGAPASRKKSENINSRERSERARFLSFTDSAVPARLKPRSQATRAGVAESSSLAVALVTHRIAPDLFPQPSSPFLHAGGVCRSLSTAAKRERCRSRTRAVLAPFPAALSLSERATVWHAGGGGGFGLHAPCGLPVCFFTPVKFSAPSY